MLKTCIFFVAEGRKKLKFFGCKFLKKVFSANKEGPCPDRSTILVFPGGTEENHGLPPTPQLTPWSLDVRNKFGFSVLYLHCSGEYGECKTVTSEVGLETFKFCAFVSYDRLANTLLYFYVSNGCSLKACIFRSCMP